MSGKKGYPTQPAYPAQQGYPQQVPQQHQVPMPGYAQQGPPPPYAAPQAYGYAPPQYQPYQMPYGQAPPQMAQYQVAPPGATVHVPQAYDAGARFDTGATANVPGQPQQASAAFIPPPPPGMMPNAAQMATAQGHNVVMGQRNQGFWSGGSDGGANWGF